MTFQGAKLGQMKATMAPDGLLRVEVPREVPALEARERTIPIQLEPVQVGEKVAAPKATRQAK